MRKEVNVLITSVSRKVWLVKAFKNALHNEGIEGKVISVDANPMSAALYVSDKHYIVPFTSDPRYLPTLLDICSKEDVSLIIPTRDAELPFFAKNKHLFEEQGIKVMVSDPPIIDVCNDKYKFYQFLKDHNINTPETYLPEQIKAGISPKYPVIIKPRYGAGSKGIFKATTKKELNFFLNYVESPVVQEFIEGTEYTIDVFSDFERRVISIVPRERIEVVGGESYKGKTVKDIKLIKEAKKLVEALGTVGHVTLQGIVNSGEIYFIEVNPRFGGGAALGFIAGADTPRLLIRLLLGRPVRPMIGEFLDEVFMLRYTQDIYLYKGRIIHDKNKGNSI